MNVPLLDLVAQYQGIKDEVLRAMMAVVERQGFIMGPEVAQLEGEVAQLAGTRHAIGCASGTDALLLPLRALDMKPGDEVITTAFTFFATAGAIHNAGGTPVFVDIDPGTFNISPRAIQDAISPRTRGIVAVHLFGQMAPMEEIVPLARRHGLVLIEDGAQAIGARRKVDGEWRRAGELGSVGTFSFFPSKNLGGFGDGGMMVTQDDELADRLRKLRLHGGARQYHHDEVGYNSRLDTLQAAVLLAKLPHLAGWSAARAARARRYTEAFRGHPIGVPSRDRPGQRAHIPSVHPPGPAAKRAPGPSQGQRDRECDLLSVGLAPAAVLRPSGLWPGQPAHHRGRHGLGDLAADLPRADRGAAGCRDRRGAGISCLTVTRGNRWTTCRR